MEAIYQIKVNNMYVAQPRVHVTKPDPFKKYIGFWKPKHQEDQYTFVDCLYAPEPVSLSFKTEMLEFVMVELIKQFGDENVELFELAPIQLFPEVKAIETTDSEPFVADEVIASFVSDIRSYIDVNGLNHKIPEEELVAMGQVLEQNYLNLIGGMLEGKDITDAITEKTSGD